MELMGDFPRSTRGEKNTSAKLTAEKVREIRRKRAAGAKLKDLAAEYDVVKSLISEICNYRVWTHVE